MISPSWTSDGQNVLIAYLAATKFKLPIMVSFNQPPGIEDPELLFEMEKMAVTHLAEVLKR